MLPSLTKVSAARPKQKLEEHSCNLYILNDDLGVKCSQGHELACRKKDMENVATTMLELWNLRDTPNEEQLLFQSVTCNGAASRYEVTDPDTLLNVRYSNRFRLAQTILPESADAIDGHLHKEGFTFHLHEKMAMHACMRTCPKRCLQP